MLQRAASNAYSWWWASHIRTTQSKWLDANLQEMETRVKIMLKLLGEEADSFGKRAEMYYRRRPEVISHVEEVYRAYRALVERYDHISKELHKANHTIATACPEEVQYARLEEENDDFPKAITPINSRKINKPTVEEILRKKREGQSAQKEGSHGRFTSSTSKEKPEDEISRLQKAILVLQTEKEFVKSSYESGIAKYWEIEKQIADMQEEICHMQGAFDMDAAIEDDEARALMTVTALKSCQDTVARLVEQFEELIRSARMESEKIRPLQEKLKIMKGDHDQSPNVCVNTSGDSKEVGTTNMQLDDRVCSIDRGIFELQPIYEKIEKFFEINSESSVEEMVEKVDELVDKVMNLKLNFPKQAAQIKQLKEENKDLENKLDDLQDEMALRDSPSDLNDQFKQLEDECNRVVVLEQSIFEGEAALKTTFTEVFSCVANISKKIEYLGPEDQVALSSSTGNGQTVLESQPSTEVKEKTVAHDGKENFIEEKNLMQEEELREKELPKEGGQTHLIVSETVNAVKRDECSKEDPLEEAAHNSLGGMDDIQHPKNGSEENFPADNDIIQEEFRDEKLLQIGNQVEFFIVCSKNQNDLNKTDKCSKESSSEEVSQSSSCGISKIQDTGSDGNANFVPGEKYRDEDSRTLGNQMHPLLAIRTNNLNKKEDCSGEDSAAEVSESSLGGANKIWDLYDGEEKFAKDNSLIQEELNEEKPLETVEQISVTGSENRCHQTSIHVLNRGSEGIEVLNQQASEVPRNSENIDNHIPHSQLERNNSKHKELVREASNSSNCRSRSIRSEKLTSIGEEVAPSWQEFLLNGLEGREAILLADYTSILRNYKETKRRLAELEKENQEHLEETNAVIIELRNANSMKYVEIQSLRKLLNSSEMPLSKADANTAHFSSIISVKEVDRSNHNVDREISTVEETNVSHTDSTKNASPFEVKFRHEIDVLVDENLQFLVRYSMACHRMQEFDSKYQELQNEMEQLEDENAEEPEAVTRPEPTTEKKLRELKTELDVWFEQNALLNQELQRKTASLCRMQEEISEALHASSEIDGARFTPYESAKFQGEVLNMQQSNNKIQSELQAALYSMRELQAKVNEALRKLCESFELSSRRSSQRKAESSYQNQFKHFPSRTRVPLRNFLFGTKPKKKSIFACINPAFQKQFSDLGGNKW